MEATAADYFAAMIAEYDSLVRRAVPVYDEMIDRMVAYAPERVECVLELGCGTGNLAVSMARRYPRARLTLVDASPEMLRRSRLRLPDAPELRTVEARFEDLDLPPASFDLVCSCLSLHHVVDKAAVFARVRELLAPGGTFLFGDQMGGASARHHALNWDAMVSFWRRPGHLSPAEQASLEEHVVRHDHYLPIVDHLALLGAAGFEELDVVWRSYMWGVVTARAAGAAAPASAPVTTA